MTWDYSTGWLAGRLGSVKGRYLANSREWWRGYHAGRAAREEARHEEV